MREIYQKEHFNNFTDAIGVEIICGFFMKLLNKQWTQLNLNFRMQC